MNVCVESLYTLDGSTDKRRMMEMIRVMNGAVYLSKSQTGDVIYRYNRYEKKILEKQLTSFDKGINRAENNAENQKRDILRKWSLVFGKKRAVAESIINFDQMLTTAIELRDTMKHDDYEEAIVIQEPVHIAINENKTPSGDTDSDETVSVAQTDNRQSSIPRLVRHRPAFVGLQRFQKATLPMLPRTQIGDFTTSKSSVIAEELWKKKAEDDRRKALPIFERSMIHGFLQKQHKLHEDLLTRNVVCKIKTNLDTGHPFYKHRLKGKLPNSASLLVQKIERERTESRLNSQCSSPDFKSPRIKSGNIISVNADINNLSRSNTQLEKSYTKLRPRTVHFT